MFDTRIRITALVIQDTLLSVILSHANTTQQISAHFNYKDSENPIAPLLVFAGPSSMFVVIAN